RSAQSQKASRAHYDAVCAGRDAAEQNASGNVSKYRFDFNVGQHQRAHACVFAVNFLTGSERLEAYTAHDVGAARRVQQLANQRPIRAFTQPEATFDAHIGAEKERRAALVVRGAFALHTAWITRIPHGSCPQTPV